jgi:hypothetical protein
MNSRSSFGPNAILLTERFVALLHILSPTLLGPLLQPGALSTASRSKRFGERYRACHFFPSLGWGMALLSTTTTFFMWCAHRVNCSPLSHKHSSTPPHKVLRPYRFQQLRHTQSQIIMIYLCLGSTLCCTGFLTSD